MDISSTIKFRDICDMFEKVKQSKQVRRKEQVLRRYYDSFCRHREAYRQKAGLTADQTENGDSSFYPVLRLLLPGTDSARESYGLQITVLGRLYTRVLQLAKDSKDAKDLEHRSFSALRDYADIVHAVLLPRCKNKPSNLTLKQIHDMLDIIAKENISSKERELIRFTDVASPTEQKWLIRLLLKSMKLGIEEQRILAVLHPNAKDIYQRCSSLSRVCILLADNKLTLNETTSSTSSTSSAQTRDVAINLNDIIAPFQQIRPMLCERFPGKIEELLKSDVIYMETKMDGERFQLHYADGRFKYISRNGIDYTDSFGSNYQQGTLTPLLRPLLPLHLQSIILDGEMMVWDRFQQRYRDKGENTDVKHLKPERSWQPCFVVYDLLYLNGQSLLDMTYVQRAYKIQELLTEQRGVLQIMRGRKIGSKEQFISMFQEALDANSEGIVLKKQNSSYKPGVRVGGGWYKDKADYIKGLTTEFDLLIIGGFYNRTRTFIETFLLGVLKPNANERDEVYSVGSVANNTRQRTVLNHTLKPHWHEAASEPPPMWYHYQASHAEGSPDVWIEPDKSIILQIRAADLAPYAAYATPKALHFPRTDLVRDDKVWNECMTLQEYTALCQGRVGIKKINKRQLCSADFETERKRQKLTTAQRNKLGLAAYEKRYDAQQLEPNSQLLEGYSLCILSGSPQRRYSKQQLQALAAQNGGIIVENPLPNDVTCICVAGDITYYVERLMQQTPLTNDIVRLDWLLRVCERQEISVRPKDMVCATAALQAQFAKSYDKLGDSYTDLISSVAELQEILDDISDAELNAVEIDDCELARMEAMLLGAATPNFFRNIHGYFYNATGMSHELAKLHFMQRGGHCITDCENAQQMLNVTHIFVAAVHSMDTQAFDAWHQQHIGSRPTKVQILNIDWIVQSQRARCKLPAEQFLWPAAS